MPHQSLRSYRPPTDRTNEGDPSITVPETFIPPIGERAAEYLPDDPYGRPTGRSKEMPSDPSSMSVLRGPQPTSYDSIRDVKRTR